MTTSQCIRFLVMKRGSAEVVMMGVLLACVSPKAVRMIIECNACSMRQRCSSRWRAVGHGLRECMGMMREKVVESRSCFA